MNDRSPRARRAASWLLMYALSAAIPAGSGEAQFPVEIRFPADARYLPADGEAEAVVFRHASHFPAAGNRCDGCHTGLYKMLAPTGRTSHAEMEAGRSCGSCHDGKKAFGLKDMESCETCHSGEEANAGGGPKDAVFVASADSPGRVTFRHATHGTRAGLSCAGCHGGLFAKQVGTAGKDPSALHGDKACGACHDGQKAFAVTDMERCTRCHADQEAGQ